MWRIVIIALSYIPALFLLQGIADWAFDFSESFNRFLTLPVFSVAFHYSFTRVYVLVCSIFYLLDHKAGVMKIILTPLKVLSLFYTFRFFYLVLVKDYSFKRAYQT